MEHTQIPWELVEHNQAVGQRLAGRYRIIAEARKVETAILDELSNEPLATDLIAVLPAMSEANGKFICTAVNNHDRLALIASKLIAIRSDTQEAQMLFSEKNRPTNTDELERYRFLADAASALKLKELED